MLHAYVILCLVLNPTQCIRYEIVNTDLEVPSVTACMMGGAIFSTINDHALRIGDLDYRANGGVRCEMDPPRVGEVEDWVEQEKERVARSQPQTK